MAGFFDDPANQPPPMNGSSYTTPPAVPPNLSSYLNGGSILDPYTQQYHQPTEAQALATPGVQFALDEALRVGQNGAAAKGTLLNGRVQQALQTNAVNQAMQSYGDISNRNLSEWLTNYGLFKDNQDRPYAKLTGTAALGKPAGSS